ncbi:hypothetical protein K8Z49_17300 [Actinomadura madurae]|uniref:hypothetical protein n=1 Tax=Actinomadura madurae TaxID=1993 RepID=UPI00399B5C07
MLFIFDAMIRALGYYFGTGHKVMLSIGFIVLVALVLWRIVLIRRRAQRRRR